MVSTEEIYKTIERWVKPLEEISDGLDEAKERGKEIFENAKEIGETDVVNGLSEESDFMESIDKKNS